MGKAHVHHTEHAHVMHDDKAVHSGSDAHAGHDKADMHDMKGLHDMAGMPGMSGTSGIHGGHGNHVACFRRLFWIMLALAVPVVGFNDMFAHLIDYQLPNAAWIPWVSPVLGTIMYFWSGRPFLSGGMGEIRSRQPVMMLLIALAITVAFLASWGSSLELLDHHLDFWLELALLLVIMLLGHSVEMRSLAQTSSALDSLAARLPDEAEKVVGEDVVAVPHPSWCSAMS